MNNISSSVIKTDHADKVSGRAVYAADYMSESMLFGRILRSTIPKGIVTDVKLPHLPKGFFYIDKNDIPAVNEVHIVKDDTPVFTDKAEYIGDAVGMLVGPCESDVNNLFEQIKIEYEELEPILDARSSDVVFFDYTVNKGNIDLAFKEADSIFEGSYETGLQEHIYLETNAMIAVYKDGVMQIHGSMQCPYYLQNAVSNVLGLSPDNVIIKQDVTGGGFGGKEDFPSVLACQVAVAAYKAEGKPVRVVFTRQEDIISTPKRHPSRSRYIVAVKDGRVTGISGDLLLDAGAYTTLSMVVLQRAIFAASGVYNIPNLMIHGHARKTNTVPNGAFRGFGGPQAFFAIEMCMSQIASQLGIDSALFKATHFVKQHDLTSTNGKFHFPVPLPAMSSTVLRESDYARKRDEYKNQTGRYRRGIGFSAVYHGVGFTGNSERDIIKAVVSLHKHADGTVDVLTAGTDMGQGLLTTFAKITAAALNIPLDRINVRLPDTSNVPDSGPTIASRSITVVGELIRRAASRLKTEWIDNTEQTVTQEYEHPEFMIPFDNDAFTGDAYPTYSWAVTVAEVEADTLTGQIKITGAWGNYDIGTIIDENIATGQMEGGLVQSLGYAMMEKITVNNGKLSNVNLTDYIIPTAADFPSVNVMFHTCEYPEGPFGAKGAGELSHIGGAPAVIDAISNALGVKISKIPFLPEDVIYALQKNQTQKT